MCCAVHGLDIGKYIWFCTQHGLQEAAGCICTNSCSTGHAAFQLPTRYNCCRADLLADQLREPRFCAPAVQHDNHLPVLTVGETLEFAHACAGARPDFISKEELKDV
jgi:hypothetical protein